MYELKVTNEYDQTLQLTQNPNYTIKEVSGLDPPEAIINKTRNANTDGSEFNSSYLNDRQIIITMTIEAPAEENRNNLYIYFRSKKAVKIAYKNGIRDVFAKGIVKDIDVQFFAKKQVAQITIDCMNPYFLENEDASGDISATQQLFEFPFAIEEPIPFSEISTTEPIEVVNEGNDPTGVIITITPISSRTVQSPITIKNLTNGMIFRIYESLDEGDELIIDSIKGEKSVKVIVNTIEFNVLSEIDRTSDWIELIPGINRLLITEGTSGIPQINAMISFTPKYQGV